MIKAVLFDMDGTLVNSERHYCEGTYKWLKRLNYDVKKEDIYGIIGLTMDGTYKYLHDLCGISIEEAIEENNHYFGIEDPLKYENYIFEDTQMALKSLKEQNVLIGICSMSPENEIKKCLISLNLNQYVDYYLSGDDVLRQKPEPDIYLKALNVLKLNSDEAIVVEDAPSGIEASKKAGLYTCARKDKQFSLDQSKADCLLEKLDDIVDVLRGMNDE